MNLCRRLLVVASFFAFASLGSAQPALGHVSVSPTEAPADGYANIEFSASHGCEGSPTTSVRVRIPETVASATPQVKPGWETQTVQGPKESTELHGETITEGVEEIIWTAIDEPLPDDRLDTFGVSVRLPAGVGETVYFPVVQNCAEGVHRWIEIPAEGESSDSLDEPAPAIELTANDDQSAGNGDDVSAGSGSSEGGSDGSDGGSDSNGLAIAALIVGGLGFLTGGISLLRTRS